jgi:hypothetical protein
MSLSVSATSVLMQLEGGTLCFPTWIADSILIVDHWRPCLLLGSPRPVCFACDRGGLFDPFNIDDERDAAVADHRRLNVAARTNHGGRFVAGAATVEDATRLAGMRQWCAYYRPVPGHGKRAS